MLSRVVSWFKQPIPATCSCPCKSQSPEKKDIPQGKLDGVVENPKRRRYQRLSPHQHNMIIESANQGMLMYKISRLMKLSPSTVYMIVQKHRIKQKNNAVTQ